MADPFHVRFQVPADIATDGQLCADYMRVIWPNEQRHFYRILSHGPAQPVTPWEWEVVPLDKDIVAIVGSCMAEPR